MEASKYQLAEWRVSIYGRKLSEWDKLGALPPSPLVHHK